MNTASEFNHSVLVAVRYTGILDGH